MYRPLIRLVAAAGLITVGASAFQASAGDVDPAFHEVEPGEDWSMIAATRGLTGTDSNGRDDAVSTAADRLQVANNTAAATSDSQDLLDGRILLVPPPTASGSPATTTTTGAPTTTRVVTTQAPTTTVAATSPTTTAAATSPTTAPATTPAPTTTMAHQMPGLHVDPASIPADDQDSTSFGPSLIAQTNSPSPESTGFNGIMHTDCVFSHARYDDPIISPGQPGASHLHAFYGDSTFDGDSTATRSAGAGSTCSGGTANATAYWTPAIVDGRGDRAFVADYLQIYYRSGFRHPSPPQVTAPPAGLRMVAGRTMGSNGPNPGIDRTSFECREGAILPAQETIPNCPAGSTLVMMVEFPQCWNGRDLDSPDHRSHMAYASNGCPASHPVVLPEIVQWYFYRDVPAGIAANWRLASDVYAGPAGYTAHADWWNGWDPAIMQQVLDGCLNAMIGNSRVDCHMNLLGDGRELRFLG